MISIVEEPVIAFSAPVNQAIEIIVLERGILLAIRFSVVARLYDISFASGFQEGFEPAVDQCDFVFLK